MPPALHPKTAMAVTRSAGGCRSAALALSEATNVYAIRRGISVNTQGPHHPHRMTLPSCLLIHFAKNRDISISLFRVDPLTMMPAWIDGSHSIQLQCWPGQNAEALCMARSQSELRRSAEDEGHQMDAVIDTGWPARRRARQELRDADASLNDQRI